jgi:tight adherence protein B
MRWIGAAGPAFLAVYFLWVSRSARSAAIARAKLASHQVSLTGEVGAARVSRIGTATRWVEGTRPAVSLRGLLASSGLPLGWQPLLRCWMATVLVLPVSLLLLTRSPVAVPLGIAASLALPGISLKALGRARERKKVEQCDMLAADLALFLRSGIPAEDALVLCARDAGPAVQDAVRCFTAGVSVGADVDTAFGELVDELGSRDLQLIAQAMATSRQTGSEISGIMDTIGETVRERAAIRRELATQTVQGRLSGRVVAALPLIFLALSALVSKSTLGVLIGSTPGLIILVVALCLNAAGFLWIRKILDIEE